MDYIFGMYIGLQRLTNMSQSQIISLNSLTDQKLKKISKIFRIAN